MILDTLLDGVFSQGYTRVMTGTRSCPSDPAQVAQKCGILSILDCGHHLQMQLSLVDIRALTCPQTSLVVAQSLESQRGIAETFSMLTNQASLGSVGRNGIAGSAAKMGSAIDCRKQLSLSRLKLNTC